MANPTLRAFRTRALFRALLALAAIGGSIPLGVGRMFGRALGRLAWHVVRRERRKALKHIAIAFPEWPEAQRRETIRRMFRHLGMSLFEVLWMRRRHFDMRTRGSTTIVEGLEPLAELVRAGRGVVAFTGHCGNWEWVARTIASYFPLTVIQRDRDDAEMNAFLQELRTGGGVRSIGRGSASSAKEMIQALRGGGLLAFLIDQNIRTESVKVPFFGRPALTPIGPARLAIRTEAVVVSIFIERRVDGMQLVRILPPRETKRGDDPVALTAAITNEIEAQIRRAPEQWVWMHDRWRERPEWEVQP